jgi:CubicO group peptidase (beta-lactamase class C family)
MRLMSYQLIPYNMKKVLLLVALLPLFSRSQDLASRADELLSAYHKQGKFNGTVLLAKGGQVIFEKGYGLADTKTGVPNSGLTEFRIGSMSKPFTAILILQLREQGLLSLTDPVTKFIPGYPKGDSIRIEQLLNHTSGIRSITSMKEYYAQWMAKPSTLEKTISHFRDEPLNFSPGTRFEYSNSNYILLSYIAEKVSRKSLAQLLKAGIVQKAGLSATGLDQNDRPSRQKAAGYAASPEADFAPARFNDMSVLSGAGGMYATARDLYAWDRALYGNSLLSPASKALMFAPQKGNYGLGWEIREKGGRKEVSHSGSIDGFVSNYIRFPEQDACIIFLSNYFDSKSPQICKALAALLFGEAYELPKERKVITLPAAVYGRYAGQYGMEGGPVLTIAVEDGKLKGKLGNQPSFDLLAESETKFFIKQVDADVEFLKDTAGQVSGLTLKQGKTLQFKRL